MAWRGVTAWIGAMVLTAGMALADPASPVNLGYFNGLAMNGYDVMSYWRGGTPQEGDPAISAEHKGATWLFVSEENRTAFLADPDAYAPQYGGYCAYAASRNALSDVDPFAWRIWQDKHYLNADPQVRRMWANRIDENIVLGDGYWPGLIATE